MSLLERAIALEPGYAQAHGLRAVCLAWRGFQGWEDRETTFAEAAESARLAVGHDPDEPWAAVGRGFVGVARHRDAESVEAFGRAVDLSPNFAYAHGLLGAAHALGGRPDEAIPSIDRAVRLSPRDIFLDEFQLYYAFAHFQAARYADAALAAEQSFRRRPGHPAPCIIAAASYGLSGDVARATELVGQLMTLDRRIWPATLRSTSSTATRRTGAALRRVFGPAACKSSPTGRGRARGRRRRPPAAPPSRK